MAKRVDNDSTMELSTSQLVPDKPDHDASVWGQVVVSPEQFSPKVPPAPAAKPTSRAALWIFLGFLAIAAIGGSLIFLLR